MRVVVSSVRFFFRSKFDFVSRSNFRLRVQIYRADPGGSRIEFRSGKGVGLQVSKSAFFFSLVAFSGSVCTWCGGRVLETNA